LVQVGNCMTYADFQSSGLVYLPEAQTADDGSCGGCHNQGESGFWASYGTVNGVDQSMLMFQKTQQMPYLTKYIAASLSASGDFMGLEPSNAIQNQSTQAATCVPGPGNNNFCHPIFELSDTVQTAIGTFVSNSITAWHNGQCAAPTSPSGEGGADGGAD
jgi:hypothetical protein